MGDEVVPTGSSQRNPLRIYLQYEYLPAHQLAQLLSGVDELFEIMYWVDIPAMIGTPFPAAARLRVAEAATGQSITLEFVNGVSHAVSGLDPTLVGIGGGVSVVVTIARLLIHTFTTAHRALIDAQRRAHELSTQRSKTELELARQGIELADLQADLELKQSVYSAIRATTTTDFYDAVTSREPLVERLVGALIQTWEALHGDNIRAATINEVDVTAPHDAAR